MGFLELFGTLDFSLVDVARHIPIVGVPCGILLVYGARTTSTSEKSSVPKPHQTTQDNSKGER